MRTSLHRSSFLILCLVLLFATGNLPADSLFDQPDLQTIPYRPGELLTYKVKLRGIPAGKWTMRVLPEAEINGQTAYQFESKTKTKGLFRLYKFEDSQKSYVSKVDLSPLRYQKDLHDGSFHASVQVDFDHSEGQADQQYNGKHRQLEIPRGIQDELSMVYLMRRKQLKFGTKYEFGLLTLKRILQVTVQIVLRERIKTVLGKRETLVLRSTHGYRIWLTNDDQRIPVRIEADTRIGKITGELEAIQ